MFWLIVRFFVVGHSTSMYMYACTHLLLTRLQHSVVFLFNHTFYSSLQTIKLKETVCPFLFDFYLYNYPLSVLTFERRPWIEVFLTWDNSASLTLTDSENDEVNIQNYIQCSSSFFLPFRVYIRKCLHGTAIIYAQQIIRMQGHFEVVMTLLYSLKPWLVCWTNKYSTRLHTWVFWKFTSNGIIDSRNGVYSVWCIGSNN